MPPWPERIKIHVDSFQDPGDSDDDDDNGDNNNQDDNNGGDGGNGDDNGNGSGVGLRGGGSGHKFLPDRSPLWTGGWANVQPTWPQPNSNQGSEGGDTIFNSSPAGWSGDDDIDGAGGDAEQDGDGEECEESVPEELDKSSDGGDLEEGELRVWSYGAYLLGNNEEYRHVDYYLRKLVAQCLCDNPRYRPRLRWLEREVRRTMEPDSDDNAEDGDGGDDDQGGKRAYSDEQIKRWMKKLWDEPPAVRGERARQAARNRRVGAN
jgi:hypothetical protein